MTKKNNILIGKALHKCVGCGRFRESKECNICDSRHNQVVLCLRISAHAGVFTQIICG